MNVQWKGTVHPSNRFKQCPPSGHGNYTAVQDLAHKIFDPCTVVCSQYTFHANLKSMAHQVIVHSRAGT